MVIVRLRGGLGNQLFQFAAGKALADHCGVELKLDTYAYSVHKYRSFELDNFKIDLNLASRIEVHRFTGGNSIVRYINKRRNYKGVEGVFTQPYFHFYPDFLQLPDSIYLNGYWQSEKYFQSVSDQIREFYIPNIIDAHNQMVIDEMAVQNSVSIHVRRGDYAQNPMYSSFFRLLNREYYQRAIEMVIDRIDSPVFYLFSDDMGPQLDYLSSLDNVTVVDLNRDRDSYMDLVLMSSCKHNIIANSTFSWWGAWLNPNPDKIVIAPEKRYTQTRKPGKRQVYLSSEYDEGDYLPESWTSISI